MKFYVVSDRYGVVLNCARTLRQAKFQAAVYGLSRWSVQEVDVRVEAETIRRLLGEQGGYAMATRGREFDGLSEVKG